MVAALHLKETTPEEHLDQKAQLQQKLEKIRQAKKEVFHHAIFLNSRLKCHYISCLFLKAAAKNSGWTSPRIGEKAVSALVVTKQAKRGHVRRAKVDKTHDEHFASDF